MITFVSLAGLTQTHLSHQQGSSERQSHRLTLEDNASVEYMTRYIGGVAEVHAKRRSSAIWAVDAITASPRGHAAALPYRSSGTYSREGQRHGAHPKLSASGLRSTCRDCRRTVKLAPGVARVGGAKQQTSRLPSSPKADCAPCPMTRSTSSSKPSRWRKKRQTKRRRRRPGVRQRRRWLLPRETRRVSQTFLLIEVQNKNLSYVNSCGNAQLSRSLSHE